MSEFVVNDAVVSPTGKNRPVEKEAQIFVASQWQLMWWRFSAHKIALFSGIVVILIYFVALFAEFLAPTSPDMVDAKLLYAPPQALYLFELFPGRAFLPACIWI